MLLVIAVGVLWILKPWVPEIELTNPGPTGERIVERGIFANFYPAEESDAPAVLLLGGSEGGIGNGTATVATGLQEAGFNVLAPSYFGAPGQPGNLELIPLETFDRALEWLRSRAEIDPDRIAVFGHSKGAEAALLVGVRHPELRAVIASAPSSAVWPGIDWNWIDPASSWTSDGRALDVVPYGGVALFGDIGRLYTEGLKSLRQHPDAAIPVERIKAPVLLICGEADSLWPACPMARQLNARADEKDGPPVRILAYQRAGHRASGPPLPRDDSQYAGLGRWGGTPAANNAARTDSWPKIVEFLRTDRR